MERVQIMSGNLTTPAASTVNPSEATVNRSDSPDQAISKPAEPSVTPETGYNNSRDIKPSKETQLTSAGKKETLSHGEGHTTEAKAKTTGMIGHLPIRVT